MTTPLFTWKNLNVSIKKHSHSNFFNVLAQFSVRENLLVVAGSPETKNLKDMMPDILKQVGPQQYSFLKEALGSMGKGGAAVADDDDDDEVPELVGTFEDAQKKWGTITSLWAVEESNERINNHFSQGVNIEWIKSFTQSIELSKDYR